MNAQERLARSQQTSAKVTKLLDKRMRLANEKLAKRLGKAWSGEAAHRPTAGSDVLDPLGVFGVVHGVCSFGVSRAGWPAA